MIGMIFIEAFDTDTLFLATHIKTNQFNWFLFVSYKRTLCNFHWKIVFSFVFYIFFFFNQKIYWSYVLKIKTFVNRYGEGNIIYSTKLNYSIMYGIYTLFHQNKKRKKNSKIYHHLILMISKLYGKKYQKTSCNVILISAKVNSNQIEVYKKRKKKYHIFIRYIDWKY